MQAVDKAAFLAKRIRWREKACEVAFGMVIYLQPLIGIRTCSLNLSHHGYKKNVIAKASSGGGGSITSRRMSIATTAMLAAAAVYASSAVSAAAAAKVDQGDGETLLNIPQTLSGECALPQDCKKRRRIQRPNSRKAESCTTKCVTTCIRGGGGSPGEGPLNIRKPLVVFKQGFRSRLYCLEECSDICNLIGDRDDGP